MKTLTLRKREGINYKDFVKRTALESDFKTLIKEDCICIDEDKNILFIYCQLPFDDTEIVGALNRIDYDETVRTAGLKTTSKIFGNMPRIVTRADYCRAAKFAEDQPREHTAVCQYGVKIAGLYSEFSPEVYEKHQTIMREKVLAQYQLGDTPFTSGIINKNNPLKYHHDKGNFKNVYSAMTVFKHDIEGGYLALPEYDVGVELVNNSLFMFDGQEILHGVTPIKRTSDQSMRYSIVYYSMQQMWNCLPLEEEVARIRDLKTRREQKRWRQLKGEEAYDAQMVVSARKAKLKAQEPGEDVGDEFYNAH